MVISLRSCAFSVASWGCAENGKFKPRWLSLEGSDNKKIPVKQNRLNDNCLTCVIKEYLLSFKRRGWRSKRFSKFAFGKGEEK